jgi:predicted Zn-dependent protease
LFQNAIQENPSCLPAYINLTEWYTSHRQFDRAIEYGQHAVQIAPEGLPGRRNLAHALIQAGRPKDAIGVLRPLAEHKVQDLDLWRTLGECFVAEHDWRNAEAALETAMGCANYSSDRQDISAMLDSVRQHPGRGLGNH